MPKFDYVRAGSIAEALKLIDDDAYTNRILAGGTDLMVYLHYEEPEFDRVVDINMIDELKIIQRGGDTVRLGAGVTFTEIIENEMLNEAAPFLIEACKKVGGPQIRNSGTIGGNLANAAACADSLPVLVSLDARALLRGKDGERDLLVSDVVRGPNNTQIKSGELLTHLVFDIPPAGARTAFIKLGRRNAQAISRLTMAAIGRVDRDKKIDFIRLVPGAATPQTMRFTEAEELLLGKQPCAALFEDAGRKVADIMITITGRRWSTEYKEPVIATLAKRALGRVFSEQIPTSSG